jgi:UDP-N-acetylglucosamine--N-acetylmuramyl-(pentapeptide) pyrophosphoryl-undecaprenol N-acetylglucosamine transferase
VEVLYVGSFDGMEASIVGRAGLPYRAVETGQIRGVTPAAAWRSVRKLTAGYKQAKALIGEWEADAVLVTGGYVSVPVTMAAWRSRTPTMIFLPDLEPGWAIRFLSRFADRVAVSFEEASDRFPKGKVVVSGYPVRTALQRADRAAAHKALGLDPALGTLLVMGGSRGARAINRALGDTLHDLLARYQIIHISGELDWSWVRERHAELPSELRNRYHAYPYMHEELVAAMAATDLVVARAGAATLAEFPAVGLPSILVPYPYAGQHQGVNADFVVGHGAAVRIEDADLTTRLKPTVVGLLDDRETLAQMRRKSQSLARPDAAQKLVTELRHLSRGRELQAQ